MLILRPPWDSQPQEAAAPSANWAGRLIQLSVGGSFYNLATGLPETKYGSMARATGAAGVSDAPTLSGNDWIEAIGPDASDFAIVSVFVPQSVSGIQQIVGADPVSDAPRQFQLRASGTSLEFIRFITTAANFAATISSALQVGRPVCVVAVSSGQTISLYTRDKSASATTGGTPQNWAKDALRSSWFMRRVSAAAGPGSEPSSHLHALRAVIRGAISNAEALSLAADPWQLFEPQRVYIPLSTTSGAYTLNLETGAYSFTGSSATLTKDSKLTLDSGTYTLSGSNASLLKGLVLEASSGSYSLTGSDASLFYTHLLNASSGSYSVTGSDATLTYTPTAGAYTLNLESGAYVLLGQDVTFVYSGSEVTLKAGSWIRYRIIT